MYPAIVCKNSIRQQEDYRRTDLRIGNGISLCKWHTESDLRELHIVRNRKALKLWKRRNESYSPAISKYLFYFLIIFKWGNIETSCYATFSNFKPSFPCNSQLDLLQDHEPHFSQTAATTTTKQLFAQRSLSVQDRLNSDNYGSCNKSNLQL